MAWQRPWQHCSSQSSRLIPEIIPASSPPAVQVISPCQTARIVVTHLAAMIQHNIYKYLFIHADIFVYLSVYFLITMLVLCILIFILTYWAQSLEWARNRIQSIRKLLENHPVWHGLICIGAIQGCNVKYRNLLHQQQCIYINDTHICIHVCIKKTWMLDAMNIQYTLVAIFAFKFAV